MLDDLQSDGLHVALARMAWTTTPVVRLYHHYEDDTLIAEIVEADPAQEVFALNRLLVEFDSKRDDAMPTTLYLTGVRAARDTAAASTARTILGEVVWATAAALIAGSSTQADVQLSAEQSMEMRLKWRGLATRLRKVGVRAERRIGVALVPGRIDAVLTDAGATVLDEVEVTLTTNDPEDVVNAVAQAIDDLTTRSPDRATAQCPVGLQLGGPVHAASGVVEFYDKPLHDGDESWKRIPLGEMLIAKTGRHVCVANDAVALAAHATTVGLGRRPAKMVVLVVQRGIGAKLVRNGKVDEDLPLEIGVFVPAPGAGLDHTPPTSENSIEADSGVDAIVRAVDAVVDSKCDSIESAATVAEQVDAARDEFWRAGAGLARVVAAVQTIVDPEEWVVYGPPALTDTSRRSGQAFLQGLNNVKNHLGYGGLWPASITPRELTGRLGALSAAIALDGERRGATVQRARRQ